MYRLAIARCYPGNDYCTQDYPGKREAVHSEISNLLLIVSTYQAVVNGNYNAERK